MKITNILRVESIIPELRSQDKNGVIKELAEAVIRSEPSLSTDRLYEVLLEREKLGSTGIGSGVAIPHGKLPNLERIVAAFGRSHPGVDFDSQDGEPAHLFFVLVAPENTAGLHLKALAKLSRLLKDAQFRQKLMDVSDAAAIFQAIEIEDDKA